MMLGNEMKNMFRLYSTSLLLSPNFTQNIAQ